MKNIKKQIIFSFPNKIFTSVKKNLNPLLSKTTFVSGLVSGILFGLIVNVLTIQIQEQVTRQQFLEALEFEIMGHYTQSTSTLEGINQARVNDLAPNQYLFKQRFNTNVWESGAALGYIYTLEPTAQAQLSTYYSSVVNPSNQNISKMDAAMDDFEFALADCIVNDGQCEQQSAAYYRSPFFYEDFYVMQNQQISSRSAEVLYEFQPTNERLKNPLLRLLMGKKALPILGSERTN